MFCACVDSRHWRHECDSNEFAARRSLLIACGLLWWSIQLYLEIRQSSSRQIKIIRLTKFVVVTRMFNSVTDNYDSHSTHPFPVCQSYRKSFVRKKNRWEHQIGTQERILSSVDRGNWKNQIRLTDLVQSHLNASLRRRHTGHTTERLVSDKIHFHAIGIFSLSFVVVGCLFCYFLLFNRSLSAAF